MPSQSLLLSIHFFSILLLLSSSAFAFTSSEIKKWCAHTPYPKTCQHHLMMSKTITGSSTTPLSSDDQKSRFLQLAMQHALDRAVITERSTASFGPKCQTQPEKAAWADCLELYEAAVLRLNETIGSYSPKKKCTQADAQTWLSTALTNLETCRAGLAELGVAHRLLPFISDNNVTQLISNTLALNRNTRNATDSTLTYGHNSNQIMGGFPTWVKPGDRKLLLQTSARAAAANAVVAKDGSGNYRTVNEAVAAAAKKKGPGRYVIYVKAGTYEENVEIGRNLKNMMLVGDGKGRTVITGSKHMGGGTTTFRSATVGVVGDGFMAQGITFRNTAGPNNHQAVALRSGSDLSVFYQCSFEGYQDTLYPHSGRQFVRECDIYGTVDFIFGNAAVVFQNCNIYARNPPSKTNTITAQGRTDPNQNTGISILNSRVSAAPDLIPVQKSVKTYLGRPWRQYSRTVFMETSLEGLVNPAGWLEWNENFALNTLYYGEYKNSGAGAGTAQRVKWGGYRVIRSPSEASKFTVANFIAGNSWLPSTRVPFSASL